jgi:hypothetical protein
MLQRFQDRVGTAGLIVAMVALVAAMGGGAYAASGALTGKQKKEVEKIAKKYAGKPGAPGANGTNGATGPAGGAGAKGDVGTKGEKGDKGDPGTPGKNGESVEAVAVPTGQTTCGGNGGTVIEPQEVPVCNGSPWVVGGLPSGKSETGTWAFGALAAATNPVYVPVSFTVPLEAGKTVGVHFVNALGEEEEGGAGTGPATVCLGTFKVPTAPAGVLCVYEQSVAVNGVPEITANFDLALGTGVATGPGVGKAGISGTNLAFHTSEAEGFARGNWAVTAP